MLCWGSRFPGPAFRGGHLEILYGFKFYTGSDSMDWWEGGSFVAMGAGPDGGPRRQIPRHRGPRRLACASRRPGVFQPRQPGFNRPIQRILSPRLSRSGSTPKLFLSEAAQLKRRGLPCRACPSRGEDGVVRAGFGARGQQSEVTNVVPVPVGHVVGQGGQEVSRGVAGHDPLSGPRVLGQEVDFLTVNSPEPVLCDGGTAGIAARVAEELLLTLEPLDVDMPPAFVLLAQPFGQLRAVRSVSSTPRRYASLRYVMTA